MAVPDAHFLFAVGGADARIHVKHNASRRTAGVNLVDRDRLPADDPAHRRIMAQPLSVVDVLVSGQPPENGLPQHTHKRVPGRYCRCGHR